MATFNVCGAGGGGGPANQAPQSSATLISVKLSNNPTKRPAYFHFCWPPLQKFKLREAISEKIRALIISEAWPRES
jgi:hypothetical protein